jgi:hypothetical protein
METFTARDVAEAGYSSPLSLFDAEHILLETDIFDIAQPNYSPGRQVQGSTCSSINRMLRFDSDALRQMEEQ